MCGFIAQLVEHRTGIAEVTGSSPVEALIFFRLLLSDCLNWKTYCDDHSLLSFLCVGQATKTVSVNFFPFKESFAQLRYVTFVACHERWKKKKTNRVFDGDLNQ